MEQKVTNFARFYALFNRLPYGGDREELKKQIVMQYTCGRTEHLRKMKRQEYDGCCNGLEKMIPCYDDSRALYVKEIRFKRSAALHQMQLYGVDTGNWSRVDAFCMDPRISGKKFSQLDSDELDALSVKVRAIRRKKEKE